MLLWAAVFSWTDTTNMLLSGAAVFLLFCAIPVSPGKSLSIMPDQIHVSFGDSPDTMVVMWSSKDRVNGSVWYDKDRERLKITADSVINDLPPGSDKALKFIHRAVMKNLSNDGVCYFYKVCLSYEDAKICSDLYSFTTQNDTRDSPLKFLVYGDMGASKDIPTFKALEQEVATGTYSAIWHVGDIGYNLFSDYGKVGDDFLRQVQPFAARLPYMTAPGNHEIDVDFLHYRTRFSMPNTAWPIPLNKMWYSYDIGPVHFISYSTEVFFTYNEYYACEQYDWLLKDLLQANTNRDMRPWIIAMGHRPMYCSNHNGDDCTGRFLHRWVKYSLEELFHTQGVDLIIEAHEHSYERLWPVFNNEVWGKNYTNPRACVHIISGAAGTLEGMNWFGKTPGGAWSAFQADRTSRFTYGRLTVYNSSHIHFQQVGVMGSNTIDQFWLQQNHHGPFVNITCTGSEKGPPCACPPPVRYVLYLVFGSLGALLFLISIVVACLLWRRYMKQLDDRNAAMERRLLMKDSQGDEDEVLFA